jgi:hypothetical protein
MKKIPLLQLTLLFATLSHAQCDTIFSNNQKIPCSIQEITLEAVRYNRVDEKVVNSIHKNMVQKIVFSNGRKEVFTSTLSLQSVTGANDFDKVSISESEDEVAGLFKIGLVSAKARGTTFLSNQNRVKKRAYRKLKIIAAMQGANTIYVTHERSKGNSVGIVRSNSSSSITGIAYTNILPDFDAFKKMISDKTNFLAIRHTQLSNGASDMLQSDLSSQLTIDKLVNENGIIMVHGHLYGELQEYRFRVISFEEGFFHIYYTTAEKSIQVKIKIMD